MSSNVLNVYIRYIGWRHSVLAGWRQCQYCWGFLVIVFSRISKRLCPNQKKWLTVNRLVADPVPMV